MASAAPNSRSAKVRMTSMMYLTDIKTLREGLGRDRSGVWNIQIDFDQTQNNPLFIKIFGDDLYLHSICGAGKIWWHFNYDNRKSFDYGGSKEVFHHKSKEAGHYNNLGLKMQNAPKHNMLETFLHVTKFNGKTDEMMGDIVLLIFSVSEALRFDSIRDAMHKHMFEGTKIIPKDHYGTVTNWRKRKTVNGDELQHLDNL